MQIYLINLSFTSPKQKQKWDPEIKWNAMFSWTVNAREEYDLVTINLGKVSKAYLLRFFSVSSGLVFTYCILP